MRCWNALRPGISASHAAFSVEYFRFFLRTNPQGVHCALMHPCRTQVALQGIDWCIKFKSAETEPSSFQYSLRSEVVHSVDGSHWAVCCCSVPTEQLSMLQYDQIIDRKQTNFDSETEWELDATSILNPTNQDEPLQFHIFYLILYIYPHWLYLNAFESFWKTKCWLKWSCGPCSPCPTTVSLFCGFWGFFFSWRNFLTNIRWFAGFASCSRLMENCCDWKEIVGLGLALTGMKTHRRLFGWTIC